MHERWSPQRLTFQKMKNKAYAYLPFLIVFRPISGSSTGSKVSPMFSIRTQSPFATPRSIVSRYLEDKASISTKSVKLVPLFILSMFLH